MNLTFYSLCEAQRTFTTLSCARRTDIKVSSRDCVLKDTIRLCRAAHGAHRQKKVGQSGNVAIKRWNCLWKPANFEIIWTLKASRVGRERRIRPKRQFLVPHSAESTQSPPASANPQRTSKDKVKWMEHQLDEVEEFHLGIAVQRSVNTSESSQRSRRPAVNRRCQEEELKCWLEAEPAVTWTKSGSVQLTGGITVITPTGSDPCLANTGPRGSVQCTENMSQISRIKMVLSGWSNVTSVWWNLWFCGLIALMWRFY